MRACTVATARPGDDRPGSEPVPGYRLVARVGSGGAGDVWRAEAPGGLQVALKIVRLGDGLGRREMANLRILRAIRHPNLLAYFGAWQRDGRLIIGMELADRSLWDRFAEARNQGLAGIPRGELLTILGDVARVIDFLNEPRHQLDERSDVAIHHRDIKPQNVMLIGQGVKVADFGLSCLGDPGGSARSQSGLTFAYAAPECFRRRVSSTSDQYSLAVTFCQLRGGRLPFVGPPASVMMGHLFGEPDLSMLPEPERPAVERALAKQPGERWPDCRSFLDILAGCAGAGSPDVLVAEPDSSTGSGESSCIEIPPLSGSWDGSTSVSSYNSDPADGDISVSSYCLDLPSPGAPEACPQDERSSAPTVVVAAAETFARRRSPRIIAAAASLLVAGLIGWLSWARPHTRAAMPSPSRRTAALPSSPRQDGLATRVAAAHDPRDPRVLAVPGRREAPSSARRPGHAPDPAMSRPAARRPVPPIELVRSDRPVRTPIASAPATTAAARPSDLRSWAPLIRKATADARTWLAGALATRQLSIDPARVSSTGPTRSGSTPDIRLGMPELLEVEAGRTLSIPIRLDRAGHADPLEVHFQGLPPGVTIPDVTIAPGQDQDRAVLRARLDASAMTVPVTMVVRGGPARSEAQFRLRVRGNPAMLHRTRGHTLLACGRPAEAVIAFTKAMEAGVQDPFVYNNRGMAYFALNQLDRAIGDYTEASRLRPADPVIRYNRGVAYSRRGDDVRALLDFETAIRLDPDHARAYEARAQIYRKRGDMARSLADSNRAAELNRAPHADGQPPAPCPPPSHAVADSGTAEPGVTPSLPTR